MGEAASGVEGEEGGVVVGVEETMHWVDVGVVSRLVM